MEDKHMKRCATLAFREMQVRPRMRHYYTSTRMATIRRTIMAIPNTGKDGENLDYSYNAEKNIKWYNHSETQCGSVLKKSIHVIIL